MALTRTEETDLLIPLFAGITENPRFSVFLDRLLRRTQADRILLVMRQGDVAHGQIHQWQSGRSLPITAADSSATGPFDRDRFLYESLRPGRVYSIGELVEHDPIARVERRRRMAQLGLGDERVVRIQIDEVCSAWLVLARAGVCTASDGALLASLAPYMRMALDTMLKVERAEMRARITSMGLRRAALGWLLLDAEARLVANDPDMPTFWQAHCGTSLRIGERIMGLDVTSERELSNAAAEFAAEPTLPARAVLLRANPRIEALLLPDDYKDTFSARTTMALIPLRHPCLPENIERMAKLFDLPRREAELAMSVADGNSIADAAAEMGLTLETARNYSKRIYAKLGVHGQADLVRLVHESCAGLR